MFRNRCQVRVRTVHMIFELVQQFMLSIHLEQFHKCLIDDFGRILFLGNHGGIHCSITGIFTGVQIESYM